MTQKTRRMVITALAASGLPIPAWASTSEAGGRWQPGASLPRRVQEIYPAVLDGRIYLAGGLEARDGPNVDSVSDQLFILSNPGQPGAAWETKAALPEPRHHPNLVGHDGFVYAVGGFRPAADGIWEMLDTTTRYDPATDRWVERASMPVPFAETCAVSLGSLIHVATGRQPLGQTNANWPDHGDRGDHFAYDPAADRWSRRAPNPNPRNSAAGVVLDGRFHVIGGRRVNAGNEVHHEAYDPSTDSWQSLAPLPQGQAGLAAAVVGGLIYAFGGEYFENGGGVYPEVWAYDPQADAWQTGPAMLTPRHGLGGVSLDGEIYAIGGASSASGRNTTDLVERLRPAD